MITIDYHPDDCREEHNPVWYSSKLSNNTMNLPREPREDRIHPAMGKRRWDARLCCWVLLAGPAVDPVDRRTPRTRTAEPVQGLGRQWAIRDRSTGFNLWYVKAGSREEALQEGMRLARVCGGDPRDVIVAGA